MKRRKRRFQRHIAVASVFVGTWWLTAAVLSVFAGESWAELTRPVVLAGSVVMSVFLVALLLGMKLTRSRASDEHDERDKRLGGLLGHRTPSTTSCWTRLAVRTS